MCYCRYLFVHGYNVSLVDLVDKIASPMVKESMIARTYKKLDSYPTPADYALALDICAPLHCDILADLHSPTCSVASS